MLKHTEARTEDPAGGGGREPSPALVREAVARILSSDAFDAPERNRRFLEYIVEQKLTGDEGRIKAYSIAIAVFGRDDGFDPQTDPIVRIEASRLRRSLERYYLLAGKDDAVRIDIPKGGYVPTFEHHLPAGASGSAAPRPALAQRRLPGSFSAWAFGATGAVVVAVLVWLATGLSLPDAGADPSSDAASAPSGPRIFVKPFIDDSGQTTGERLARGLTREIIVGLTHFSDLIVFDVETAPGRAAVSETAAADSGVDYVVQGGVAAEAGRIRASASLFDVASGRYLWSARFESAADAGSLLAARDQVADQIVRALAQPYGVLFSSTISDIADEPLETLSAYECVLLYQRYWRAPTAAAFPSVRQCLERAILLEPDYAEAFASLALTYVDNYRFGFGEPIEDALGRAGVLATRAIELAPASARGHKALFLVHWLTGDVERSIEAAERALSLNPNDTEMMAELGLRYVLRNQMQRGLALIDRAYALNGNLPGIYRIGPFLQHYREGRFADALAEAKRIGVSDVIYGHICLAMAQAQLGHGEAAAAAIAKIEAIDPAYGDKVVAELAKRNMHPDFSEMVVEGLRKAGLAIAGDEWLRAP
jgi:adenylate cyclase